MNAKKLLAYPMKFTVMYLLFTIVLFVFGPIRWNIPSYVKLIAFLLVYIIFFAWGYSYQLNKKMRRANQEVLLDLANAESPNFGFLVNVPFRKVSFIFFISCIYSIVRAIILMMHLYGSIDFSSLFSMNFAESYFDRLHSSVQGRWYVFALDLVYVLDLFWYILGILYYKKLSSCYKVLFYITLVINAVYNAMGGTMISWALFVLKLIPLFILEWYKNKVGQGQKQKSKKRMTMLLIICIAFLLLFGMTQEFRYQYMGYEKVTFQTGELVHFIEEEQDWPLIGSIVLPLNFYLTHGYCGMAYALELEPEFTYVLGFSRGFAKTVNSYLGIDVSGDIYPQRLEDATGWQNGLYWPTAYTWFASDITFYGIPILMFIFGCFLCNVWYSALYEKSVVATVLFSWLWVGIVFIPANNQLFQAFNMFMGTVILIVFYILRKQLPRPVFAR